MNWFVRTRFWVLGGILMALVLGVGPALRIVHAKSFLSTLADPSERAPTPLLEQELTIDGRSGPIRARVYRAANGARAPGIVVAHGVHYQGIDERRLVPFVRALARSGYTVLTPELTELADYRLTRGSVDRIIDASQYLAAQKSWVTDAPLGLIGFSFAGGLSLVAASEPPLAGRLAYVVSVGGHHDLARVLHFLLSDQIETPTGIVHEKAHDYGLAVVLYGNMKEFVPPNEVAGAEAVFRAWLHEDRALAKELASKFVPGSASEKLFTLVTHQELKSLAPELNALLERDRARLSELSPRGKLERIGAPVYLLHGAHDSVIPASEASFAALELGSHRHAALISPLIDHVEVGKSAKLTDQLALLAFLSHLF